MFLFKPDGSVLNTKPRMKLKEGTQIATKGEVPCWSNKYYGTRQENGTVNGIGTIIEGPDQFERYLIRIKGMSVWIQMGKFIAAGVYIPGNG